MKSLAKVASTASGLDFDEWMRRPVYKTHCITFRIACRLCGVEPRPGEGLRTVHGQESEGLARFRCLPPYRTEAANKLRLLVARHIKMMRKNPDLSNA